MHSDDTRADGLPPKDQAANSDAQAASDQPAQAEPAGEPTVDPAVPASEDGPGAARLAELRRSARRVVLVTVIAVLLVAVSDWGQYCGLLRVLVPAALVLAASFLAWAPRVIAALASRAKAQDVKLRSLTWTLMGLLLATQVPAVLLAAGGAFLR